MKQGAVAVFVKTAGVSPVKTRLAEGLGLQGALEFYQLAWPCVKQVVDGACTEFSWAAYWAVAERSQLNAEVWPDWPRLWQGDGGLGERLHRLYCSLQLKYGSVILLGADAPQVRVSDLSRAMSCLDYHDYVVGPAADGGFYLFGGKVPVEETVWLETPYSVDTTLERLQFALGARKGAALRSLTDVDTVADLKVLSQEFPKERDCTSAQRALNQWLTKTTGTLP